MSDDREELEKFLLATDRAVAYQNQLEFLQQEYLARSTMVIDGHVFIVNLDLLKWADWALNEMEERDMDSVVILDQDSRPVLISDIPNFHEDVHAVFHEALNHYYDEYTRLAESKSVKEIVGAV